MMADPPVIQFFVHVKGKTQLETNMQVFAQWADQSTFEVRGLRVVMSTPSAPGRVDQGVGTLSELINNSVVTLVVGEKIMIQAPTWFFGAGESAFRFSEPVVLERQQNFRVEMSFPHGLEPNALGGLKGPFRIWVVLDGSLTRTHGNRRTRRSRRKP